MAGFSTFEAMTVLDEHGRPTRVIGTSHDVTERIRRTEAERANRAKTKFISRMSHELRTPLNAILGFGQLMTMSDLDERQRANVDHILTAGKHLLDLINEILDVSRIESGELRLVLEPVSVRSAIAEAIDLVAPTASAREIDITAVGDDLEICALADAQRLKQVLLNLLSNAMKYSDQQGRVRVHARRRAGRAQIIVEDDGPGIEPEMIDRLFSPFDRLGWEHSPVEGTGLGLTVSRGMIEAMGGRIEVRSKPGEGAAFTIDLEIAPDRDDLTAPVDHNRSEGRSAHRPTKLLCIDDNPLSIDQLKQGLRRRPHIKVLGAFRGEAGTKLARDQAPDLILLDLSLPDMSFEEVVARLKADPATRSVPVVTLAAPRSGTLACRGVAGDEALHLNKPLDVNELMKTIDDLAAASLDEAA